MNTRQLLAILAGLALSVLANELFDLAPGLTRGISKLIAQLDADNADEVDLIYNELTSRLDAMPGKLLPLGVAIAFLLKVAVLRRIQDACLNVWFRTQVRACLLRRRIKRLGRRHTALASENGVEGYPHNELTPADALHKADEGDKKPATAGEQRRPHPAIDGLRGRLAIAAAAALCLLISLSGMSLALARDALPGDPLYSIKRSAESAELGSTFGTQSRGFKYLQFATTRVDEMEALLAKTSGTTQTTSTNRHLTALDAFDAEAAAGSQLLIESAISGESNALVALNHWVEQQHQRIRAMSTTMPQQAAIRTGRSLALLREIAERSQAIHQ